VASTPQQPQVSTDDNSYFQQVQNDILHRLDKERLHLSGLYMGTEFSGQVIPRILSSLPSSGSITHGSAKKNQKVPE
jgi:hypothetical protein